MSNIKIVPITAAQTWDLRHRVMWPHKPLAYVIVPNDEQGQHWGLWLDDELISVVSLFVEGSSAQFRKFATDTTHQGKGYGTLLLKRLIAEAKQQHIQTLWCHARCSASTFYQGFGLQVVGEVFVKDEIAYCKMQMDV